MSEEQGKTSEKLQIFRAADAPGLMEAGIMSLAPFSEIQQAGIEKLIEAGFFEGEEIKVLINVPGFSLVHVWFKKDYPLPLHSHNADCLYYVVAGSIALGTDALGPGDGFFIKANVPYTYRSGPEGAEVLEFRTANHFDFVNHARNEAFYDRAVETIAENLEEWRRVKPPSQRDKRA